MGELQWQEDSKELFDKMMGAVPDEMKSMAEPMLTGMITQKAGGGPVTRQVLADVVDGLPEPQKSMLKGVLASGAAAEQGTTELQWADGKVEQLFERLVQVHGPQVGFHFSAEYEKPLGELTRLDAGIFNLF